MKAIILSIFLIASASELFSQSADAREDIPVKQIYDSICVRNDILLDQIDLDHLHKYGGAFIDIRKKGKKYIIDIYYNKTPILWSVKGRKIRGKVSHYGHDVAIYMPFENPFFAPVRLLNYGSGTVDGSSVVAPPVNNGTDMRNDPKKYIYRNGELFEFVK